MKPDLGVPMACAVRRPNSAVRLVVMAISVAALAVGGCGRGQESSTLFTGLSFDANPVLDAVGLVGLAAGCRDFRSLAPWHIEPVTSLGSAFDPELRLAMVSNPETATVNPAIRFLVAAAGHRELGDAARLLRELSPEALDQLLAEPGGETYQSDREAILRAAGIYAQALEALESHGFRDHWVETRLPSLEIIVQRLAARTPNRDLSSLIGRLLGRRGPQESVRVLLCTTASPPVSRLPGNAVCLDIQVATPGNAVQSSVRLLVSGAPLQGDLANRLSDALADQPMYQKALAIWSELHPSPRPEATAPQGERRAEFVAHQVTYAAECLVVYSFFPREESIDYFLVDRASLPLAPICFESLRSNPQWSIRDMLRDLVGKAEKGELEIPGILGDETEIFWEAERLFAEGDCKAAASLYSRVLANAERRHPVVDLHYGMALKALHRKEEALSHFQAAASSDPTYPWWLLPQILLEAGDLLEEREPSTEVLLLYRQVLEADNWLGSHAEARSRLSTLPPLLEPRQPQSQQ